MNVKPKKVLAVPDLDAFTCFEGLEEERLFCTALTSVLRNDPRDIEPDDFITICNDFAILMRQELEVDPVIHPKIVKSHLYNAIIWKQDILISSELIIKTAMFCFKIEENDPYILELLEELD